MFTKRGHPLSRHINDDIIKRQLSVRVRDEHSLQLPIIVGALQAANNALRVHR